MYLAVQFLGSNDVHQSQMETEEYHKSFTEKVENEDKQTLRSWDLQLRDLGLTTWLSFCASAVSGLCAAETDMSFNWLW